MKQCLAAHAHISYMMFIYVHICVCVCVWGVVIVFICLHGEVAVWRAVGGSAFVGAAQRPSVLGRIDKAVTVYPLSI